MGDNDFSLRAGGLGLLAGSLFAFAPVLFAQTIILAGFIGDRIWHAGVHLASFDWEIPVAILFLVLIVLAPLCFFVIRLESARQLARREFGLLPSQYVNDFHRKSIAKRSKCVDPLLGQDLQSLSDLGNAYNAVSGVRLLPFNSQTVIQLTIIVALPFLPLLLSLVPLHDIIQRLVKLVF